MTAATADSDTAAIHRRYVRGLIVSLLIGGAPDRRWPGRRRMPACSLAGDLARDHCAGMRLIQIALHVLYPAVVEHDDERRTVGRERLLHALDSRGALLLEQLTDDTDAFDVVVVESLTHAYSRIRRMIPDLVIVLMEIGDVASCRLLSMLAIDRATAGIPVVTCATPQISTALAEGMC